MAENATAIPATQARELRQHAWFACACLGVVGISWGSLRAWLEFSRSSTQASDLWIIPLISIFLVYERRSAIFARTKASRGALLFVALGIGVEEAGRLLSSAHAGAALNAISLAMLGVAVALAAAFVGCYGEEAGRAARFPLYFLLLAVPIPQTVLDVVVRWLQDGSAAVVNVLFVLLRVPHVHDGLRFYLDGLSIEIATECSGIRSSFSLLVLTVLLSYTLLHSTWRRIALVSTVVPLVLVKNGIRIVTLCLLSIYVDPSFITGSLHHSGGFVFFGMALMMEGALCWLLLRGERRAEVSR